MFTKKKVEKENEGYYDVEKKHIVIGEQLPKMYVFDDLDHRKISKMLPRMVRKRMKMFC